jgi:biotin carboxylase
MTYDFEPPYSLVALNWLPTSHNNLSNQIAAYREHSADIFAPPPNAAQHANGHAFEARLYAESPAKQFLPGGLN